VAKIVDATIIVKAVAERFRSVSGLSQVVVKGREVVQANGVEDGGFVGSKKLGHLAADGDEGTCDVWVAGILVKVMTESTQRHFLDSPPKTKKGIEGYGIFARGPDMTGCDQ